MFTEKSGLWSPVFQIGQTYFFKGTYYAVLLVEFYALASRITTGVQRLGKRRKVTQTCNVVERPVSA
jgi:hypothetical protein